MLKLHEHSFRRDFQHAGTAIESMKLIIFICKNRFCILCIVLWYLFFLNKYFIISTIIWCYAVYSDSHQNMMKKNSGNFYNHMQLHNLFYYNNMMFQRAGAAAKGLRDPMNIEMQIYSFRNWFFLLSFLGDIFWSFMELNKRRKKFTLGSINIYSVGVILYKLLMKWD